VVVSGKYGDEPTGSGTTYLFMSEMDTVWIYISSL
jgi:hypothetical protein